MYRINFYPEFVERRLARRRRILRTTLVAGLVGLEGMFVAFLAVSGMLMRERTDAARQDAGRLAATLRTRSGPRPEIEDALALLQIRQQRIDWSPILAGLSNRIDPSLRLTEVTGRVSGKEHGARIELTGLLRAGSTSTLPVSRFLSALQADSAVARTFDEIKLGTLGQGGSDRFRIVCEQKETPQ